MKHLLLIIGLIAFLFAGSAFKTEHVIKEMQSTKNKVENTFISPLTKEEIKELESSLSLKQKQTVSIINRIDPTLISGIKIRFDDKVIDGSMKSRIENLRSVLREGRSI